TRNCSRLQRQEPGRAGENAEIAGSRAAGGQHTLDGAIQSLDDMEDLNKFPGIVVFTRRLVRGLHGQQGRLDEATGKASFPQGQPMPWKGGTQQRTAGELFRDFKGKSRAELEKMRKCGPRAAGGQHAGTAPSRVWTTWRCAPALWSSSAPRNKSHLSAKHFEDLNAALAVVFERRLGKAFVDNKGRVGEAASGHHSGHPARTVKLGQLSSSHGYQNLKVV
uniref:DNA helicase n=1 Tax=Macrostomum lignano TaxID=282301 RepID=A0A1I8FJD1_9PLAT